MFGAALDDRTQSALEKKVQMLKLGEHVRFMGWRTPGVRWIAACDMLMVPAIDEPFGRTLIEAMLVGHPLWRPDRAVISKHCAMAISVSLSSLKAPARWPLPANAIAILRPLPNPWLIAPGRMHAVALGKMHMRGRSWRYTTACPVDARKSVV